MKLKKFIGFLGIVVGIIGLLFGIQTFFVGYHNFDYSRNVMHFLYRKGFPFSEYLKWKEILIGGDTMGIEELYFSGLKSLLNGFAISLVSAFILGASLILFIV